MAKKFHPVLLARPLIAQCAFIRRVHLQVCPADSNSAFFAFIRPKKATVTRRMTSAGRALERIKAWSADHAAAIGNGAPPELLARAAERAHCFVVPRDHSVGLFCLHL